MVSHTKKQLRKLHAMDSNLPHSQHIEMTVRDDKGKTQGKIDVDIFGKVPKKMMVK